MFVQPDVDAAAQPDVDVAAQPVVDAAVQTEVDSVAQPLVDAVAQPAIEAEAQPEVGAAAQPDVEAAAQPDVNVAAQPVVDAAVQTEVDSVAQPLVDAVAQPVVDTAVQTEVDSVAQPAVAPDAAPTVASDRFTTTEALLATVEDGSVRPLSGRYLIRLAEGESLLKRRQDLPEEAFFVPSEELLAKLPGPSYQKYFFMALSYRWLTESHPDPERFHLTIVSHVVRVYLELWSRHGIVDVGIFWDFGSLHQKPRVNNEEVLFKEGLRASNRWYGSSESVVLLQRHLPPGFHGAPYDESGWCFVEAAISSAITDGFCRLDLGKLEIGDGGHVTTKGSWGDIMTKCCENRMPPLLPETVRKLLEQEKTFTTKSDVGSVAELYQRFFDDVSTSVEALSFAKCGWTRDHVSDLGKALPRFTKLHVLNLAANDLQDEGAEVLASALKASPSITVLYLDGNKIGDDGARALAEAVKESATLKTLNLCLNRITDKGKAALRAAKQAAGRDVEIFL